MGIGAMKASIFDDFGVKKSRKRERKSKYEEKCLFLLINSLIAPFM